MARSIFFSWQSDVRSRAGRGLIEDSLNAAIKALKQDSKLEPATRALAIDSDVKKTPGQPPLMEVIFDKIAHCAVFVGDMTYVGERKGGKLTPNPNVLIEYGWALRATSWRRIILVMNTAFGDPKKHELPFDLRHMLHPISFECAEDADDATRKAARDGLVKDLMRALKMIFEDETALAEMMPPVPTEPHPHDVKLLQSIYTLLSPVTRSFFHQQNFGDAFPRAKLDPIYEIASWVSAAYEFHDRELQAGFAKLRAVIAPFVDITLERLYAMDRRPDMVWAMTDEDRARGMQPGTAKAIKLLNDQAAELSQAIDEFDRLAKDRIRKDLEVARDEVAEQVDPRQLKADEALTELAMDQHRGRFPVIVSRPRMILKLAPLGATGGRRLDPATVVALRDHYPRKEEEKVVKDSDAHQWWICAQPVHRKGLPNPESPWCMRIVRPGNFEYQATIGWRMEDDEDIIVDGHKLEAKVIHHFETMASFARKLGFVGRAMISLHLDGMQDVRLMRPGPGGRRMRDEQISLPRVLIGNLTDSLAPTFHEIFDIMWQSGGWANGSTSYPQGKWLGYEDAENYDWKL